MLKKYLKLFKNIVYISIFFVVVLLIDNDVTKRIVQVENINLNKTLDLAAMSETISMIEKNDLYSVLNTFVGDLTGYGADCPLCSGYLGCNGQDVRDGQIYYDDEDFGKVRIVATNKYHLTCGSIITFKSPRVPNGEVVAVVLDRGVGGTSVDLLTESEDYAKDKIGRSTITYDVLRNGWHKGE